MKKQNADDGSVDNVQTTKSDVIKNTILKMALPRWSASLRGFMNIHLSDNENDHQGRGVDSTRVSVADRDLWCIVLFWLLVRTRTQSDRTVLVLDCYAGRLYHSVLVDARVRFEFAMGMNEWVSDSRPAG